ncbi:MAG: PTS sugar transporter subunit IIB [Deltaproteobacteria bacterium]|nr:PTS sugar transporter subunit IIB [Deltaproteobacteria bacterium]
MKNIIVACGGGVATSGAVASKINTELEALGLSHKAKAEAVDIKSLELFARTADIYVSITPMPGANHDDFPIPVLNGIPFLTGVGKDEIMEKLVKLI